VQITHEHSFILAVLSKREIKFIDLARASGLWLPFTSRKQGLQTQWQRKVKGMKPWGERGLE
jgi:hypothetical protein